jgi:protein-tyrosine-phosphatase
LAAACLELAANRAWADVLGRRGRHVVDMRFSQASNGQNLVDVYRDLRSRRREARRTISLSRLALSLPMTLVQRSRRKLRSALERRRVIRLRRDPQSLRLALQTARTILIACHGNIIRSPFAARLVAQAIGAGANVTIASGGLEAIPGRPAHATAVDAATARYVDLRDHLAAPVTPAIVAASDVIFVMDIQQLLLVQRRFPEAHGRTYLLTCLAPDTAIEVRDPVDDDESAFRACYDHISQAVQPIVGLLTCAPQRS